MKSSNIAQTRSHQSNGGALMPETRPDKTNLSRSFISDAFIVYRPLHSPQDKIRLLEISTRGRCATIDSRCESDIWVETHTFSLFEAPAYRALSYHWGDRTNPVLIHLNGNHWEVTRNLAMALRQLQFHETKKFYVWIDALCINQADPEERNHKVQMMRSIYEKAELVLVSLGEDAEHSNRAFDLARELVRMKGLGCDDDIKHIISSERTARLIAFHLLLTRSYWTRVWVVQEVNSARQIQVMCGYESIPWTTLLRAQNIVNSNQVALWKLVKDEPRLWNFTSDVWYEGPRGLLSHIGAQEPTLFEALRWHCAKESTLPEDKVYAILGITSAKDDPQLVVDYSRGVHQLFIDTTTYIIRSMRKLDIICGMQHAPDRKSNMNLPSWVVDWVDAYTSCLLDGSTGAIEASASSEARFILGQDGKSVTVEGMCLGTISTVVEDLAQKDRYEPGDSTLNVLDRFDLWSLTSPILTSSDEISIPELLSSFRNFSCGRILREADLLAELSDDEAVETVLALFAWGTVAVAQPLRELAKSVAQKFTDEYLHTWAEVIFNDLQTILASRRFLICSNGLQGSGFGECSVGCKVCIFLGCATPVILKPTGVNENGDEKFVVIGDAYVDGYMHGEALVELEHKKLELKKFILI